MMGYYSDKAYPICCSENSVTTILNFPLLSNVEIISSISFCEIFPTGSKSRRYRRNSSSTLITLISLKMMLKFEKDSLRIIILFSVYF